jgi:NMD protein affecting ribosome stability and mRNA decay
MQLCKALYAFWRTLFARECEHKRVAPIPGQPARSAYCPDCGYKIAIMWTLCRCRTCGSKRHPKQNIDGHVSTLYRYCQHCGEANYQIVKKDRINVHEMPYAVLCKEIDYAEERLGNPKRAPNPFEAYRGGPIVEGEVLRKEEFSSSRV